MNHDIRILGAMTGALVMATVAASCSKKSAEPVQIPSGSEQKASFPGGAPITAADLTAAPAVLPAAPPAYDPDHPIPREEFARFAWRQFIYFNSPAKKNGTIAPGKTPVERGSIDPSRSFAASGDPGFYQSGQTPDSNFSSNVLLWQTFAHRSELFPAASAPKGDLPSLDPTYVFQNVTVDPTQARFNNLDENNQIGQNQIFFPKNPPTPSASPMDDYIILFQAKVNQVEYDFVKDEYGTPGDIKELPPTEGYPGESVEVKSAWREMPEELIQSGRYHTAEAVYYTKENGETVPKVKTFGLVGLHILRKMENYPAFVYTTFEQVDSLTTPDQQDTGLYLVTLYDEMQYDPPIAAPGAIANAGPTRTQIPLPRAGAVDGAHGYNIIPGSYSLGSGNYAGPIKVTRPSVGTLAVRSVNDEVMAAMAKTPGFESSVWKYYRLAGIQVLPTNEDTTTAGPVNPLTEDFFLANIVIESSQPGVQLFKGGVKDPGDRGTPDNQFVNQRSLANIIQVPGLTDASGTVLGGSETLVMGGCMGCHGNARLPRGTGPSLFSFLISGETLGGSGFGADARDDAPAELIQRRSYIYR